MGILVEDLLTYLHDPKAASFLSDKTKSTGKVYYGNVSTKYSSTHHPSERVALLCKIQLSHRFVVTSWRKHTLGWRSCLSRLLKVAKGSGEETRGAEIVRNFRKDALGRPCNCNGSCASQEVPEAASPCLRSSWSCGVLKASSPPQGRPQTTFLC